MMQSEQSMDRLFRTMMELCVQSAMAGARPSSTLPDASPSAGSSVPSPHVSVRGWGCVPQRALAPTGTCGGWPNGAATPICSDLRACVLWCRRCAPLCPPLPLLPLQVVLSYTGVDAMAKLVLVLVQVQDSVPLKVAILSRVAAAVMRTLIADSDFASAVLPGEEGVCTVHRFDQVRPGCLQLRLLSRPPFPPPLPCPTPLRLCVDRCGVSQVCFPPPPLHTHAPPPCVCGRWSPAAAVLAAVRRPAAGHSPGRHSG
jgi:hypothetical protein